MSVPSNAADFLGGALGRTELDERNSLIVRATVEYKPDNNRCFRCAYTATAYVRIEIKPGLPSVKQVLNSLTQQNWRKKLDALQGFRTKDPYSGAPITHPDAVRENVITDESVRIHEKDHFQRHKAWVEAAWKPYIGLTNPANWRQSAGEAADQRFCDEQAAGFQERWRQGYLAQKDAIAPRDPQTQTIIMETWAYDAQSLNLLGAKDKRTGRLITIGLAQEIQNYAAQQGWR